MYPHIGNTWFDFGIHYGLPIVVGGPIVGKIARPVGGFLARQLILKPIHKVQGKFANPVAAYTAIDSAATTADRILFGAQIVHWKVEGSSSHDLVQNGGPPALLLPSGSPSSEANGSATSSAGGDSAHGRSSAGVRGRRRHRCPSTTIVNGRRVRCQRDAGHPQKYHQYYGRYWKR